MVFLICGFMGAGKSTFLDKIQKNHTGTDFFFDLDQEIYSRKKNSDSEHLGALIEKAGWEQFRSWEIEILKELIENSKNLHSNKKADIFISLGGGSVTEVLLSIIKTNSEIHLIWLNTPFEICWQRIENDCERPLVQKGVNYLKELYKKREKYYQNARICLSASEQDMLWTTQKLKEAFDLD